MIDMSHPIVKAGKKLGWPHYGSPTTSDKALMNFPSLKIGPGDSARSHTANEFIHLSEILVKQGDEIAQGQAIAKVGKTGRATGPHLDWRMNWFEERVDPQLLVGAMPAH